MGGPFLLARLYERRFRYVTKMKGEVDAANTNSPEALMSALP